MAAGEAALDRPSFLSLRLYMDHHVKAAITIELRRREVDVITALEDGASEFDDEALFERATLFGRALFSQDRDLLEIAHRWLEAGREFAGLIYAHQLRILVGQSVGDLELRTQVLDPEEMSNRVVCIPL
ncbi:MAG: DUF5615 family PIN-like protein [Anaerolineae bacterium]